MFGRASTLAFLSCNQTTVAAFVGFPARRAFLVDAAGKTSTFVVPMAKGQVMTGFSLVDAKRAVGSFVSSSTSGGLFILDSAATEPRWTSVALPYSSQLVKVMGSDATGIVHLRGGTSTAANAIGYWSVLGN